MSSEKLIQSWRNNFFNNVTEIIVKNNVKYTWIKYEYNNKKLVCYIGNEANLYKNEENVRNVEIRQYMYRLFCELEKIVNYNYDNIKQENIKLYNLICNNLAFYFFNYCPKINKYKIKVSYYIDLISFDSRVNIAYNYIYLLVKYIFQINNIVKSFLISNFDVFILHMKNDELVKNIIDYIYIIYDEMNYEQFIENNIALSQFILQYEQKLSEREIKQDIHSIVKYIEFIDEFEEKTIYHLKNNKKENLLKNDITYFRRKISMN